MLGSGGGGGGGGWGGAVPPAASLEDSIPQDFIALLEAPHLLAALLVLIEKDTPIEIGGGRKGFADSNFNKYCECLGIFAQDKIALLPRWLYFLSNLA